MFLGNSDAWELFCKHVTHISEIEVNQASAECASISLNAAPKITPTGTYLLDRKTRRLYKAEADLATTLFQSLHQSKI